METLVQASNIFDAAFGNRDTPDDPIEYSWDLNPGERTVSQLPTFIRNDFIPKERKCLR